MTAVLGMAAVVLDGEAACDPGPYLKEKKAKKYLGLQDALAVVAAGRALADAGLPAPPPERTGLYLAVGYIPFVERDVLPVLDGSLDAAGRFSLARFAAEGYTRAHPLLAFRCLPNMPAYHVAASFGIEGPYAVLYPSAGELYLALQQAHEALHAGEVDVAVVVGVAHQRNFLVEHHMGRLDPPVPRRALRDAAAAFVLGRAGGPARAELVALEVGYEPFDPLATCPGAAPEAEELGPAAPLVAVHRALSGGAATFEHALRGRDGVVARSAWRAL